MPRKMRTSEPVRIGVPTSRPNCVSLRPSCCLIWMPMMAKIVHTAKQTVNAMVDIQSARLCPGMLVAALACMMTPAPVDRKVSGGDLRGDFNECFDADQ